MRADASNAYPLPNFFAVGPPRTGTTWLYEVLREHANLPRYNKETRFFDTYYWKGLAWYAAHFDRSDANRPLGDICPTYFYSDEARARIAELAPGAKIICTFRDPVVRVFSLYRIKRAHGWMQWSFEEALIRDPELLISARYALYLSKWRDALGNDSVLAAISDDLLLDPQAYLDRIVDFIGIPRFTLGQAHIGRVNSAEGLSEPRNIVWTRLAATTAEWLKAHHGGRLVAAAKKSILGGLFLGGGAKMAPLDPTTAARLRERFRPEVEQLESILGRDLSPWKAAPSSGSANSCSS